MLRTSGSKNISHKSLFILLIPLALSAFTHMWNPSGSPAVHPDEGVYIRRAMHILNGLGPQDPASRFDHIPATNSSYDHPYFGQIFLAGLFRIIDFPESFHSGSTIQSIEMLYVIPRLLMGLLAVLDTFLIYKIAERYYNSRTVAFTASILFAVTPLGWYSRWILLDNILMPFLLSSIFLALYLRNPDSCTNTVITAEVYFNGTRNSILILLSGIFLGLAIFTKIPAFTMIPLVGYLIFRNKRNRNIRTIALWFVPVIVIPLMWPAYALYHDDFDEWWDGVLWQGTERTGELFIIDFDEFVRADPVLLIIGIFSILYAALRKDDLLLIWFVPYLLFLSITGWLILFHWLLVLPVFCIAIGAFIDDVSRKLSKNSKKQIIMNCGTITVLGVFGLTITLMQIIPNFSSSEFAALAFAIDNIQSDKKGLTADNVTIISSPIYSWIFKYVYQNNNVFSHIRDSSVSLDTGGTLLITDRVYTSFLDGKVDEDEQQYYLISTIYNNTKPIAIFEKNDDYYEVIKNTYPYSGMIRYAWANTVEIRTSK